MWFLQKFSETYGIVVHNEKNYTNYIFDLDVALVYNG